MCLAVACPLLPRVPLALPLVVPLVVVLDPLPRPVVAFFFCGGATLMAEVSVSWVVRPKLAQMLAVEAGLFRAAGALPFWLLETVPGSW